MDEDLRNRFRRNYADEPARPRRSAPQPHQPIQQPAHVQAEPTINTKPAKKTANKRRLGRKKLLFTILIVIIIAVVAASGVFIAKNKTDKPAASAKSSYFPATIVGKSKISIPVYYPAGLPNGWTVSNFSVLKQNVFYYVVTSPKDQKFYVTIQPIPSGFDFVKFKQKFQQPDEYNTDAGDTIVGPVGSNLLASIRSTQNSWIIINTATTSSQPDMETITRAMQQSSL